MLLGSQNNKMISLKTIVTIFSLSSASLTTIKDYLHLSLSEEITWKSTTSVHTDPWMHTFF